jgi:hypothetical protein
MKKTFPLSAAGKADARVVDSVKHEVRKYVKRERKKPLPADHELWDFACKVGVDQLSAESKRLGEVSAAIDTVARTGAKSVYLEILAVPMRRTPPGLIAETPGPASPNPPVGDLPGPQSS